MVDVTSRAHELASFKVLMSPTPPFYFHMACTKKKRAENRIHSAYVKSEVLLLLPEEETEAEVSVRHTKV